MINKLAEDKEIKYLFDAILTLDSIEDCYKFFEDICTIKEMQSIAQRLAVAKMLKDGETYQAIVSATGASTATISRVNRCLNYGDGGYNIVLKRLENKYE